MGFNIKRFVKHPVKSIKKVVHNPAKQVLPKGFRESGLYRNTVRPVITTATSAAIGGALGGPIGALAAGGLRAGETALGGVKKYGAFQPTTDIIQPTIVGGISGAITGDGAVGKVLNSPSNSSVSAPVEPPAPAPGPTDAGVSAGVLRGAGASDAGVPAGVLRGAGASAISAADVAKLIIDYGGPAMDVISGLLGYKASAKQKQIAEQARLSALQGNQQALRNALQALAAEFSRITASVENAFGRNGFLASKPPGGLLSNIEAKLASDKALRERLLRSTATSTAASINSRANADRARAAANTTSSAIRTIGGLLSGLDRYYNQP